HGGKRRLFAWVVAEEGRSVVTSRIRTADAADMLGVSRRTVQSMTARGMLPGAAKIGGILTFDRAKLTRYLEGEEARCRRKISTSEGRSGGCAVPPMASSTERAYEQAIL